jgi:N-acyl-D-amino-acid deacylase
MTDRTRARRHFLCRTGSALIALAHGPALLARQAAADLVVRGAMLFDGVDLVASERDVAITGDRITAIGTRLATRGKVEIDAKGQVLCPGFIDVHSHGDRGLADDWRAESVIRQGITTIVVGADGGSPATGAEDASFAEYWRTVAAWTPSCNVASMVGLGSIRAAVIGGADRAATSGELTRMTSMVERALTDGACGASSGLEYTPGAFARTDELAAVCRPLAARRLPYATHLRNEDDVLLEAVDEALRVGREAGCPVQVSHLKAMGTRNWPKLDDVFRRFDQARSAGMDVTFDWYPYVAYSTGLSNLFPTWSLEGGSAALLARVADATQGARIREAVSAKVTLIGGWDSVQVSSVRAALDRPIEGQRLGAFAAARGLDPYELTVDLLRRSDGAVGMVGFAMDEPSLDRLIAHPLAMVCSDGGAFAVDGPTRRGHPHPRGAGTFPRVLSRYVRERRALPLGEAIRKMTSVPAARVRLSDRGRIAVGLAADLVVFDAASVADRATFAEPFQYASGISLVVVNGEVVLRDGQRSPGRPGRPLAVR